MNISIITPSYNMLPYLKRCVASVADQAQQALEHIVIDGGSTDGTVEWLQQQQIRYISESDQGMYDAINKGLKMASGDVVGYLNCDEQYLRHTLQTVTSRLEREENLDVLFGSTLLVNPEGYLLSCRKAAVARPNYIMTSVLDLHTSSMFWKRKWVDRGELFNTQYRYIGDLEFILRLMRKGAKVGCDTAYYSTFTMTGSNDSASDVALKETSDFYKQSPLWLKTFKPLYWLARHTEKWLRGAYSQRIPLEYHIFTADHVPRKHFKAENISFRWPREV